MTKLSVNINKVALIRNSRRTEAPDLIEAARVILEAGAHGITIHPRPDQRHIRFEDLKELAQLLRTEFPRAELNIEGNPFEPRGKYLELIEETCPEQCTLVPDSPEQATSDHGWNPGQDLKRLEPILAGLKKKSRRLSLFMDPQPRWILELANTGVDRIELYTESYAGAYPTPQREQVLEKYRASAQAAQKAGLEINAGHDLNRQNLNYFLLGVPQVLEVSIGHALISDAIFLGLGPTVREYLACIPGYSAHNE